MPMLRPSANPVDDLVSEWEIRLYYVVERIFLRARLDESVVIGTIALLELLHDLSLTDSTLNLPPYPQEEYFRYFLGAYMLAYRTLGRDRPLPEDDDWFKVIGNVIPADEVAEMESDFLLLIQLHLVDITVSNRSHPSIPPNNMIRVDHYLEVKSNMYEFIQLRMAARGQHVRTPCSKKEWSMEFPPCYEEMMERSVIFENVRFLFPEMCHSTEREILRFINGFSHVIEEKLEEQSQEWGWEGPRECSDIPDNYDQTTIGPLIFDR